MFESITMVIWFLLAITILVAVHEFGHFYVARLCGVKVIRFSIGFGRRLIKWSDKQGTEYALSAIPLGGYVKMLDEREVELSESEKHLSYNSKTPLQRIAIAVAGPAANFILAFIAYWIFFLPGSVAVAPVIGEVEKGSLAFQAVLSSGQEILSVDGVKTETRQDVLLKLIERLGESGNIHFVTRYWDDPEKSGALTYESVVDIKQWLRGVEEPDLLGGLGIEFYKPNYLPNIHAVMEGSRAFEAGMIAGDEILSLDGHSVGAEFNWVEYVNDRPETNIEFVVVRDEQQIVLDIKPAAILLENGNKIGRIGVSIQPNNFPESMRRLKKHGVFGASVEAYEAMISTSKLVFLSMEKLIFGEISVKNLSGPIGIAKVAADHARHGVYSFINFLAYLSLMLGILNLLPIPVLDGGHILYSLVEWVRGNPLSEKVQNIGYKFGLVLIMGLMFLALYNDILRLR